MALTELVIATGISRGEITCFCNEDVHRAKGVKRQCARILRALNCVTVGS